MPCDRHHFAIVRRLLTTGPTTPLLYGTSTAGSTLFIIVIAMTRFPTLILAVLLAVSLPPASVSAIAPAMVQIGGLRSDDGVVRIAVFASAADFPRGDAVLRIDVSVRNGSVLADLGAVPQGVYAVAFYHDENANNMFDRGLLGVPIEGFGFSNDAPVVFGPPAFQDAAVLIGPDAQIAARMRY